MKSVRAITLLTIASLLSLGVAIPPASAAVPVASLTVTGPSNGATTSSHPKFSWVVPAGAGVTYVNVSTSKATVDGELAMKVKDYVTQDIVAAGVSFDKQPFTYEPGTYYWQANTYADTTTDTIEYLSSVHRFVIPVSLKMGTFTASTAPDPGHYKPEITVHGKLTCNFTSSTHKATVTIAIFRGKKKIGGQTRAETCMGKTKMFLDWQPKPGTLKHGTKLTITVAAKYKKISTPTQTITFTWK